MTFIKHKPETSDSSQRGYGMAGIRELPDNVIFKYYFYRHTGEPYKQETDVNRITTAVKIKELEFNESGVPGEGCMWHTITRPLQLPSQ